MVKRKEESVYTSKGGILTRVISTRLTKLAKYSKAPLILSFPPPLSLLSPPVFSTFAPLLTTSFLFLLSVFFFFIFPSLLCFFFSLFFFCHCLVRHTPIAYVWPEEASSSFPLLGQPPTLKFLQSLSESRCFHSRSLFFFRRFFRFTFPTFFFVSFWFYAPPFDLDGGWCRYLRRSWSGGILNVWMGERFDLRLSRIYFRDFINIENIFFDGFRWLMEKVEFVESRRWKSFLNYRYFYSYFFIL